MPAREAAGAGSKRLYDYHGLLEFALAEELFQLGLGIHLVKSILFKARLDKIINEWADDFDSFFKKLIDEYRSQGKSLAEGHSGESIADIKKLLDRPISKDSIIKNALFNRGSLGTLFFYRNERGETNIQISPVDITFAMGIPFMIQNTSSSSSGLSVNLGKIKRRVDRRIELKFGEK